MQLNADKIKKLRADHGWTQQQLAEICGLSLRTIQRVELQGIASLETSKSLAAAFELEKAALLQSDEVVTAPTIAEKPALPVWLLLITFLAGSSCGALLLHFLG
jgi:transcriptional regulator with XRE-family HTH domain